MSVVMSGHSDWVGKVTALIDRHQVLLACIVSIAILLALHYSHGVIHLPNDAGEYWHYSKPGVLGNLATHRGYVWALLMQPLHVVADAVATPTLTTYRLVMAMAYGVVLSTLIPAVFVQAFGGKMSFLRRLVPVCLLALIFPGVLIYPLSDLPALLMALASLLCVLRGLQRSAQLTACIALMVAGGVLMGAAYNTRTIYLFALLAMLCLLAFCRRAAQTPFSKLLHLAAFVAGLLLVALPQLVINLRTHGVASLAVVSDKTEKHVFARQLLWGVTVQRYETSLANPSAEGQGVHYMDPAGARLLKGTGLDRESFTLAGYVSLVARHPMEFLALYTRHALNGLDVRDGRAYTRTPSQMRNRAALFNFGVLALACWVLWTTRDRTAASSGIQPVTASTFAPAPAGWQFSLAVLLLPVAAILPGAVETRFFLPLHLLAYCVIAFRFDAGVLWQSLRRHGLGLALALALAASVFFAVTLTTMSLVQSTRPFV